MTTEPLRPAGAPLADDDPRAAFANLVAALRARLGEGVVVRSDDVDGNDVRGVVAGATGDRAYAATFTDDGEVISLTIDD